MKKVMQKCISITLALVLICTIVPFSGMTFDSAAVDEIDVQISLTEDEQVTAREVQNPDEGGADQGQPSEYGLLDVNFTAVESDPNGNVFPELMELVQEFELEDMIPNGYDSWNDWQESLNNAVRESEQASITNESVDVDVVLDLSDCVLQETGAILSGTFADEEDVDNVVPHIEIGIDDSLQPVDENGNPITMPEYIDMVGASFSIIDVFKGLLSTVGVIISKIDDVLPKVKEAVVTFVNNVISIVTPVVVEIKKAILTYNDTWVDSVKYHFNDETNPTAAEVVDADRGLAAIRIPNKVRFQTDDEGHYIEIPVTSIRAGAFSGFNNLQALNVPGSITTIKAGTFASSHLRYITFEKNDDGKYALTTVGIQAFANCTSLKSVYLGSEVTSIGTGAFNGCTQLQYSTQLSFEGNLGIAAYNELEKGLTQSKFSLPEQLTEIQSYTFFKCEKLGSDTAYPVNIPNAVQTIEMSAFEYSGLKDFTAGTGVKTIGTNAFAGCDNLTTVTLNNVTEIGHGAFKDNKMLSALVWGSSLKTIGPAAFKNCKALSGSMTIPASVTKIGTYAFDDTGLTEVSVQGSVSLGEAVFSECSALTSAEFTEGITSIPKGTFYKCTALTSVSLPTSIEFVEELAFYKCAKLGAVDLSGTQKIGISAFADCTALNSVTFSEYLEVQSNAFMDCTSLSKLSFTSVDIKESTLFGAFYHCTGLTNVEASELINAGNRSFCGCSSLRTVEATEGLNVIGDYAFAKCGALKSVTLATSLKSIGAYAFGECASLTNIEIPDSVTDSGTSTGIGDSAFYKCSALETVTLGSGISEIKDWTFGLCDNLSTINIPSGVKTIGVSSFRHCAALKTLDLQNCTSLETIDTGAFNGCESLTEVNYPTTLKAIGNRAFYNCPKMEKLTFPEGATIQTIGAQAYTYCTALTEVSLPDSVVNISGALTFVDCKDLEKVSIGSDINNNPDGIKKINPFMFCRCSSLDTITIGTSVQTIGTYAFYGCTSLKELDLKNVTDLGAYVFLRCTALTSIDLSESSTLYASQDGVLYNKAMTELIMCPAGKTGDFVLPNSVTQIAPYAFYNSKITNVTLKSSLQTIGTYAFFNCSRLRHIEMSAGHRNNIESIGDYAFCGCTNAEGNPIGKKINQIGEYAFYKCLKMFDGVTVDIRCPIGTRTFSYCDGLTNVILRDSVTSVANNAFSNHTEGLNFYVTKDWENNHTDFINKHKNFTFIEIENRELTGTVLVYGHPGIGHTLRAVLETEDENAVYRCTWYRDGEKCGSGEEYTVAQADLAKSLTVELTGTDGYDGTLVSKEISIIGPYTELELTIKPDSGVKLGATVLPDNLIDVSTGQIPENRLPVTGYLLGVGAWQQPESYASVTGGTLEGGQPKTGSCVRVMKQNCIIAEYRVVIFGDVDMDGEITTQGNITTQGDMALIRSYMDGETSLTELQKLAADVNGDNLINSQDLAQIEAEKLTQLRVNYTGAYTGKQYVRTGSYVMLPVCRQDGYSKTSDSQLVAGKTYYTESGNDYTPVSSPSDTGINTYYEKNTGYHYIFFCDYDPFDGKSPVTKDLEVTVVLEENLEIVDAPSKVHAGDTVQLTARLAVSKTPVEVKWKSSHPYFGDVNEDGLFTAKKFGKTTITATDSIGRSAYHTITVTDDLARLVIKPLGKTEVKIGLFESYSSVEMYLNYETYNCSEAVRYEWTSDNSNVQVKNGVVTHTGSVCRTANITLTAYDASDNVVAKDSIEIRVYKIEKIADFLHKWFFWLGF